MSGELRKTTVVKKCYVVVRLKNGGAKVIRWEWGDGLPFGVVEAETDLKKEYPNWGSMKSYRTNKKATKEALRGRPPPGGEVSR